MNILNATRLLGVAVFGLSLSANTLRAQDSTGTRDSRGLASYRDPHKAAVLGALFPGAGHLYAGERWPGLGIAAVAIYGIAYGAWQYNQSECAIGLFVSDSCDPRPTTELRTLAVIQIAVGAACWVVSAIDAPRAARRENAKALTRRVSFAPLVRSDGASRGLDAGVSIHW